MLSNQSGVANEVLNALNEVEPAPHAEVTSETVSSPEVKTEETKIETTPEVVVDQKAPEATVDINKLQSQIENLNTALRQERESKRTDSEKVQSLESKLAESQETIDKLRNVFAPKEETPTAEPTTPQFLTQEQLDSYMEQKTSEKLAAEEQAKKVEAVQLEIKTLESEWNGENGKPKYDDEAVLQWQKDNGKLYLSPAEAFSIMKKTDIIDWEINQRLAGKNPTPSQEKPTSVRGEHTPTENTPQTPQELRQAVLDAMDSISSGINA